MYSIYFFHGNKTNILVKQCLFSDTFIQLIGEGRLQLVGGLDDGGQLLLVEGGRHQRSQCCRAVEKEVLGL